MSLHRQSLGRLWLLLSLICAGLIAPGRPAFSQPTGPLAPQVAAPDSMPGRVPIVLYASQGGAPFRIASRLSPKQAQAPSATFVINYIPAGTQNELGDDCLAWPAGSQAAFTYAANLWGALLNSSVPIKIDACWASLGEGVLGHSATDIFYRDFAGAPQSNTWYSVALANALSSTDRNGGTAEMHIAYSDNGISWYFGTDGHPPMGQYDFVSVVLHEIAHGLNFAGSMRMSGGVGSWGLTGYTGVPVIYDRFAEDGNAVSLLNAGAYPNPSTALGNALRGQVGGVYFNGTYAKAANGNSHVKLYTPSTWSGGSSYAHLDEIFNGTANALMTYSLNDGEATHDPGPITCGIFRDLGWQNPCHTSPPPTVTSITPNSGNIIGTAHITNLAGSNFVSGATVKLTRSGLSDINATNVTVVSASQITCDFNLTGAATGPWTVMVTNPDAQSGTLPDGFTTIFSGKTWTGSASSDWHTAANWTPAGVPTSTVPTSTDDVLIPDVTRDPVLSSGDAAVNNLIINSGAVLDLTTRTLTVEGALTNNGTLKQTQTVAGSSPANFLRITNPAGDQTKYYGVDIIPASVANLAADPDKPAQPDLVTDTLTVTSITPNTGVNTGTVHITNLAGSNFQTGATVSLTKTGQTPITGTNVMMNATLITCDFDLTGAAAGAWNVVVTNPDLQSGTLPDGFTVTIPVASPIVASITPNTGVNTGTVHITNLAGSNSQSSATVYLTQSGQSNITATNVAVISATQITCDFDLTDAATGQWNVVVMNPDLQSGTLPDGFTVTGVAGVSVTVSVSGNQFCAGRTVGVKRCFDIAPASALTATVRFYLREAERNGQPLSNLLVWHYDGTEWTGEAGLHTHGGANDAQYVQAQNVKNFSPFALARTDSLVYLPLVVNRWPPVPDAPTLNAITNAGSENYDVSWNTAARAASYLLQEAANASFTGAATAYSGSGTSWSASNKPAGTYYYRVKATNSYGDSGWSNPRSIQVVLPTATVYVQNDTGGQLCFEIYGSGIGNRCYSSGKNLYGTFPVGTYSWHVSASCGSANGTQYYYSSSYVHRFWCSAGASLSVHVFTAE